MSENSQTHRTVSSGVLGREVRKVNWLSKGGSLESRWLPRIGPVLLPDRAEANLRGALHVTGRRVHCSLKIHRGTRVHCGSAIDQSASLRSGARCAPPRLSPIGVLSVRFLSRQRPLSGKLVLPLRVRSGPNRQILGHRPPTGSDRVLRSCGSGSHRWASRWANIAPPRRAAHRRIAPMRALD